MLDRYTVKPTAGRTVAYVPIPISRSQMDKLGERLARSSEISDEDDALLEQVLQAYQEALGEAQRRLAELGFRPTTRTKTTGTLIDKLRRGSSLKSVQDIAGARLVIDGGRLDQDRAVQSVLEHFRDGDRPPTVRDRRVEPTFGYRAVHVIVTLDRLPVEIQVRTVLQDLWAQVVERLGDKWGRGCRYGQGPEQPELIVAGSITRQQLFSIVLGASDAIDRVESARAAVEDVDLAMQSREGDGPEEQLALRDDRDESTRDLAREEEGLKQVLIALNEVAEQVG